MTGHDFVRFSPEILEAQSHLESLEGRLARRRKDHRKYVVMFGLTLLFTTGIMVAGAAVRHPVMVIMMVITILSAIFISIGLIGHIMDKGPILEVEDEIDKTIREISRLNAIEIERILKGDPNA